MKYKRFFVLGVLFSVTLGAFGGGVHQVFAQDVMSDASLGVSIDSVSITNDLESIIINGEGLTDVRTIALIGTSCPTLMAGNDLHTDTSIGVYNVKTFLGDCLTQYRGKQISIVLQGKNVSTSAYAVFVPEDMSAGLLEAPAPGTPTEENETPEEVPFEGSFENTTNVNWTDSGESHCEVNGKEVPCEELYESAKTGAKFFGSIVIGFLLLALLGFIFWAWLLIHAIRNPIQNKAVWIVCFLLFGIVTAIIYYFAVKRTFVHQVPVSHVQNVVPPQTPPSQPQM
jgi:hypothetical protein